MRRSRDSYDSGQDGPADVASGVEFSRDRSSHLLPELLARGVSGDGVAAPLAGEKKMNLASGRTVVCGQSADGCDELTIEGRSGSIELRVVLTPQGPLLRFDAAGMTLRSEGKIDVECDRPHVRSRRGIVHETGGDLIQRVGGNAKLAARGDLETRAREIGIDASRGDVRVSANDDVRLNGERVKLNC